MQIVGVKSGLDERNSDRRGVRGSVKCEPGESYLLYGYIDCRVSTWDVSVSTSRDVTLGGPREEGLLIKVGEKHKFG